LQIGGQLLTEYGVCPIFAKEFLDLRGEPLAFRGEPLALGGELLALLIGLLPGRDAGARTALNCGVGLGLSEVAGAAAPHGLAADKDAAYRHDDHQPPEAYPEPRSSHGAPRRRWLCR